MAIQGLNITLCKTNVHFSSCLVRAIASMRQDKAIARLDFGLFLFFFFFAPVSLGNKNVNFHTCTRLTFLKKSAMENA